MYTVNSQLVYKLKELNYRLEQTYNTLGDRKVLRNLIESRVNPIRKVIPLCSEDIKRLSDRGIVAVDGSICCVGGVYPHYIALIQALAKSTMERFEDITVEEIYTPLLHEYAGNEEGQQKDEGIKSSIMASLEAQAAITAIIQMNPRVVLMDGSLIRFNIECKEKWERLKIEALNRGILLAGVIEEVKTGNLFYFLKDHLPSTEGQHFYDRDILFGILDYGEALTVPAVGSGKFGRGIRTCFIRSSNDPHFIGLDLLEEQAEQMDFLASLILSITPREGRGIPLWLDIVDREVRVTQRMARALIDEYIDPAMVKRLLVPKRNNRNL